MPTALATTKRKFHKILDTISNASSPSLALSKPDASNASTTTLPANFAPPSKRLRVERPKSAFIPLERTSRLIPRPASLLPPVRDGEPAKDRAPPNFAPWDRNQFLERLKTFRHVDKWLGKPDKINEVQWAKRGWRCVDKETVRCVACGVTVVIRLTEDPKLKEEGESADEEPDSDDQDWREDAQNELVQRYAKMITDSHSTTCLWRRRGCDDTIHRLPLIHPSTALQGLRERYTNLAKIASELPPISHFTLPSDFDISTFASSALPVLHDPTGTTTPPSPPPANETSNSSSEPHPDPNPNPNTTSDINHPALTLSLFGWQTEEAGHIPGLVVCNACFRRLGLWLFVPPPHSPSSNWTEESALPRLDVVTEHREYCPWVNILSQNGGSRRTSLDGLAGWEVLARAVRMAVRRREELRGERRIDLDSGKGGGEDGAGQGGKGEGEEDVRSEAVSLTAEEEKARDEERKSRLKRLKEVFTVRKAGDRRSAVV